ncbi:MAG: NAD+ synthase [Gammaproteobacteria bacterium]|jgi:NAD+ synthase (glutamine-hydrolysing)
MTTPHLRVVLAQLNLTVADFDGNLKKILKAIYEARDKLHADLIVFPELTITSYPLEDLLQREDLYIHVNNTLSQIQKHTEGIDVLIGYPQTSNKGNYNSACWIRNKKIIANYHKQQLPNYGVFDEQRYFIPGNKSAVVEIKNIKFGILICEDAWHAKTVMQTKQAGAECLLCLNASPYHINKAERRLEVFKHRIAETGLPILYTNLVGGQDELVFDGGSVAINQYDEICAQAPFFAEHLLIVDFDKDANITTHNILPIQSQAESVYQALVLGVRDYVQKNNFSGAIIGLSGGIDSALTLAIATDALGADKVTAVSMPSQYTANMSNEDAKKQAETLGVKYEVIPIQNIFEEFLLNLKDIFANTKPDTTEENIQARIRGTLLMALSNKFGKIVLATGNKSEMAVGYSTLYGDMVGGFCVLKDIFKTLVYQLAEYRNKISPVIPQRVIDRPPSAELAPDQVDQDTLPPYDILDKILYLFVDKDLSIDDIVQHGFDHELVKKVVKMVYRNEYKRRQAPTGVRISEKAFGRDRRYPITSAYLKKELV